MNGQAKQCYIVLGRNIRTGYRRWIDISLAYVLFFFPQLIPCRLRFVPRSFHFHFSLD